MLIYTVYFSVHLKEVESSSLSNYCVSDCSCHNLSVNTEFDLASSSSHKTNYSDFSLSLENEVNFELNYTLHVF